MCYNAPRFVTDHVVGSFNVAPPQLGSLTLSKTFGEKAIGELKAKGHGVKIARAALGSPVMVTRDPKTGALEAAGDPTARRQARAY